MAESDPQNKRKRTWGEWLGGTKEGNAIASAEYKRGMGINPKAKDISNAEASRSARSMANPTSAPARTAPSGTKLPESKDSKPLRKAAGTYTKSYDVKPKAAEPPKASASSAAAPKKAGDKSSQAGKAKPTSVTGTPAKKMTAFERQKARMYEKEGYGGRSMTAAQAKARVEKERGQKMEMPRFLKSSSKEAPKKASGMARPQYKSQKARDFAAKMQGRNPSGKAEKSFRFKDLFK